MKCAVNKTKTTIEKLEMCDILFVGDDKKVVRWGYYANQGDGTYAIYRPENPICNIKDVMTIYDDCDPGVIDIVDAEEINAFLASIGEIKGIAASEVSAFTPCGWYYDTIV